MHLKIFRTKKVEYKNLLWLELFDLKVRHMLTVSTIFLALLAGCAKARQVTAGHTVQRVLFNLVEGLGACHLRHFRLGPLPRLPFHFTVGAEGKGIKQP